MQPFDIRLSPEAADSFRQLELFERQEVWDLLENFRIGRAFEEDYGELTPNGKLQSVVLVSDSAVSFSVDFENRVVQITDILLADR